MATIKAMATIQYKILQGEVLANLVNCKRFTKNFLPKIFLPKSSYISWLAKLCFKTEQHVVILKIDSKFYRSDSSQLASQCKICKIVQLLLIIGSCLSIAQVSYSFKHLDTYTFIYATPTFITEALYLVTQVKLILMTVTVN